MLNAFKAQYKGTILHPTVYQPILDIAAKNSSSYAQAKADIQNCIIQINKTIGSNLDSKIDEFFNYFEIRFATVATRLPHALAA